MTTLDLPAIRALLEGIEGPWRWDAKHAAFIAAAPSIVAQLVAVVEAALARADRWEEVAAAREQDNLVERDPELWLENRTRSITLRANAHNLRTALTGEGQP